MTATTADCPAHLAGGPLTCQRPLDTDPHETGHVFVASWAPHGPREGI